MKDIKRFILLSILAAFPVIIFIGLYIACDPFCIFWKTKSENITNRGYFSTRFFCENYPKYHYDSFILGSSISNYFSADAWAKFIPKNASIMHFDASTETLEGILRKLEFIQANEVKIKNALIVIEDEMLMRSHNSESHIFCIPPKLTPQHDEIHFQYINFTAFRQYEFLKKYFTGQLAHQASPAVHPITNEYITSADDSIIATNPKQFYTPELLQRISNPDYQRPTTELIMPQENIEYMKQIGKILSLEKTNYKIICFPRYQREAISTVNMAYIIDAFGKENICDFTHCSWLKQNKENYYDHLSHPRRPISNQIIELAYTQQCGLDNPIFNEN